jgi:small subunit ribosomal protein S7
MLINKKSNFLDNKSNFLFSFIIRKFINQLMKNGKKVASEKIIKNILIKISLKGYSPVNVITLAINNVKPLIEVKNIRLKGNSFQGPFPIKVSRQISLAIKTLIKSSSGKKKFEDLLVDELINSFLGKSQSIKATNVLHKLASQNKLFSHYRWF